MGVADAGVATTPRTGWAFNRIFTMYSKADLLAGIPQVRHVPAPVVVKPQLSWERVVRRRPFFIGTKSGYKGVLLCAPLKINRWKAYIRHHGQYVTLGYFPSKEAAALAYNAEAVRLFGADTHLNQVPSS